MSDKKLRVFISRRVEDRPHTHTLYNQLKQEDWIDPWLDVENLQPGQPWDVEILKALQSSNVGLVCVSTHSLPLTGQHKREILEMLERTKTTSKEEFQILTLRLDDAPLPEELANFPTTDMQTLIPTLKKIMEGR